MVHLIVSPLTERAFRAGRKANGPQVVRFIGGLCRRSNGNRLAETIVDPEIFTARRFTSPDRCPLLTKYLSRFECNIMSIVVGDKVKNLNIPEFLLSTLI